MPVTPTYPGVYPFVVPSQTLSVTAASTSNAAVIDCFSQGPVGQATQITSLNQFNLTFGGLDESSPGSYAVQQFFQNGGGLIWVVRIVPSSAVASTAPLAPFGTTTSGPSYMVQATSQGEWGDSYAFQTSTNPSPSPLSSPVPSPTFNLTLGQVSGTNNQGQPTYSPIATYYNLSLDPTQSNFAGNIINGVSQYIQIVPSAGSPVFQQSAPTSPPSQPWMVLNGGSDGTWGGTSPPSPSELTTQLTTQLTTGSAALDGIAPQVFNILILPVASFLPPDSLFEVFSYALAYCETNLAFFILDPPPPDLPQLQQIPQIQWGWGPSYVSTAGSDAQTANSLLQWAAGQGPWAGYGSYTGTNYYGAATYYPWLMVPDPLNNYQNRPIGPSGTIAGLYAANDATYGVWKAPAGVNATIQGATLAATLTDIDSGNMNPLGLNALRSFPIYGNIVWGARTLAGADLLQSQFMYINVLRLTNFIEQSLTQSLKWAVFEPNAPALWSSITLEASSFLAGLFSQGAFQGTTASQAYFVQCDGTTTTPQDMLNGVVNVIVGFAPVFPAEFVILQIELQLQQPTSSS